MYWLIIISHFVRGVGVGARHRLPKFAAGAAPRRRPGGEVAGGEAGRVVDGWNPAVEEDLPSGSAKLQGFFFFSFPFGDSKVEV